MAKNTTAAVNPTDEPVKKKITVKKAKAKKAPAAEKVVTAKKVKPTLAEVAKKKAEKTAVEQPIQYKDLKKAKANTTNTAKPRLRRTKK